MFFVIAHSRVRSVFIAVSSTAYSTEGGFSTSEMAADHCPGQEQQELILGQDMKTPQLAGIAGKMRLTQHTSPCTSL